MPGSDENCPAGESAAQSDVDEPWMIGAPPF